MASNGRVSRSGDERRGSGAAAARARVLSPLLHAPLLSAHEYALLTGVTERRARAILTRLSAAGMTGEIRLAAPSPGRPQRLAYLTAAGVAALADALATPAGRLITQYDLGERALIARLGALGRLVPARAVLIALRRAVLGAGGTLRAWQAGPVRWATSQGGGCALILDGEAILELGGEVWPVVLLWDGDPTAPPDVLSARLRLLDALAERYRGAQAMRVPPVLVVTAAATRIPAGFRPEMLWTTMDALAARGPLAALWHGGRGPGGPRPLPDALAALPSTRASPALSAMRRPGAPAAAPRNGSRLAQCLQRARMAPAAALPLGLMALALPPGARALLELVACHPLLSAGELAAAAGWRPARVRGALAALSTHNLIAMEELAGAPDWVYVATARGLRLLAAGAGLDAATYARAVGALVETKRTRRGDTQRLRFLRRTPAHTRGVSAAYLAFVQAARAADGTLEWWGEWASTLTDEDNESSLRLRPDAAGVLTLPAGRLEFLLEVDRGTTVTARLGAKLALYERYRLTADVPPFTVVLVLQGKRRAKEVLSADAARQERLWKPGVLDVRYTTASALTDQGALAPIWRNAARGDATGMLL